MRSRDPKGCCSLLRVTSEIYVVLNLSNVLKTPLKTYISDCYWNEQLCFFFKEIFYNFGAANKIHIIACYGMSHCKNFWDLFLSVTNHDFNIFLTENSKRHPNASCVAKPSRILSFQYGIFCFLREQKTGKASNVAMPLFRRISPFCCVS